MKNLKAGTARPPKKPPTVKCSGCGNIYRADFSQAPCLCKCGRLIFGIRLGQRPIQKAKS